VRHREAYPRWRNIGAFMTGVSLLIQMVPVAPPRLLPQLGFVDTAVLYGQSVYGRGGLKIAPQLAAMPSVHVAWAVLIAVAVIATSSSRYRWWILLHPTITTLAVVATANHWWLDGVVAAALLPLGVALSRVRLPVHLAPEHRVVVDDPVEERPAVEVVELVQHGPSLEGVDL
jgi:hypothetical protein